MDKTERVLLLINNTVIHSEINCRFYYIIIIHTHIYTLVYTKMRSRARDAIIFYLKLFFRQ